MYERLAIIAILALLISFSTAQDECICTYPSDYMDAEDASNLRSQLNSVIDDSASTRRMIEINTRKLDELKARQWASSGEVENLSKEINSTNFVLSNKINKQIHDSQKNIEYKIQTVKYENLFLVLLAIVIMLLYSNWIYGQKYKEWLKHAGTFPKRSPMTSRESDLELRLEELETVLEQLKEPENPAQTSEKQGMDKPTKALIGFLLLLMLAIGIVVVLAIIGVF